MSEDKKPLEVVFMPGCFDSFEGSQEELDDLIKQITSMAETGELFEKSTPVAIESLVDELSDEEIEDLIDQLADIDSPEDIKPANRNLH
jgi:hypothetical protein